MRTLPKRLDRRILSNPIHPSPLIKQILLLSKPRTPLKSTLVPTEIRIQGMSCQTDKTHALTRQLVPFVLTVIGIPVACAETVPVRGECGFRGAEDT